MKALRSYLALGLIGGVFVLGGCAGGTDVQSTSPKGNDSPFVQEARAITAQYSEPAADVGVSDPLKKLPAGKKAAIIQLNILGADLYWDAFTEASQKMGMETTVVDGGGSPDTYRKGIESALALHPDVVVIAGFDPVLFADLFEPYTKDGGKVIGTALGLSKPSPFISASFESNETQAEIARIQADWVIADSNGTANVASFWVHDFPANLAGEKGFQDEMQKCEGCTSDAIEVKASDLGTAVPSQVVSYLQSHPDVNYIVSPFAQVSLGIPAALKSSGLADRVQLISANGLPSTMGAVKSGEMAADLITHNVVKGYLIADAAARVLAGQEPQYVKRTGLYFRWVTPKTIADQDKSDWDMGFDYRAEFEKLWGIN